MLENIQRLCKAKGIAISQLERDLDFGRGSIYKWDKSSPSIDKIQKVAEYFKVSVDVVLYGFELTRFEELFRIIMNKRTCEQFAADTGIDLDTVENYAMGVTTEQPSFELVKKLANNNPYKIIVDDDSLFSAAGYPDKKKYEPNTLAAHHDGDDWTDEELEEIERFKEFVKMRRKGNKE